MTSRSQAWLSLAAPLVAGCIAAASFVFTRQHFVVSSNATAAASVQALLRDYEKDEMGSSMLCLQQALRKNPQKFAWEWAQAKEKDGREAIMLDQHRRHVSLFWSKFHVLSDGGVVSFHTFWRSNSRATLDIFPCKTRAEGYIASVEPLDYANCRVCLGKSREECRVGTGKPPIYEYLRDLYQIENVPTIAMDFVDTQLDK
jgi:hypothetical protein